MTTNATDPLDEIINDIYEMGRTDERFKQNDFKVLKPGIKKAMSEVPLPKGALYTPPNHIKKATTPTSTVDDLKTFFNKHEKSWDEAFLEALSEHFLQLVLDCIPKKKHLNKEAVYNHYHGRDCTFLGYEPSPVQEGYNQALAEIRQALTEKLS